MICNKCNKILPEDSNFCPYCRNKIEREFVISPKADDVVDVEKRIPAQTYKPKKTTKTKFCSRCGSLIDSETKICTGCGKKYFKGFILNKFTFVTIILSLILIISVVLNVIQYNDINYLFERKAELESQVSSLEDDVDYWETELSEVGWELTFYKDNAKIVGDDGSNKYHEYGCSDLDTSNGFWIFNT